MATADNVAGIAAALDGIPSGKERSQARRQGIMWATLGRAILFVGYKVLLIIPGIVLLAAAYLVLYGLVKFEHEILKAMGRTDPHGPIGRSISKLIEPVSWAVAKPAAWLQAGLLGIFGRLSRAQHRSDQFRGAVREIMTLNLVMSVDNILLIRAITNNIWVILASVVLSMVMMLVLTPAFERLMKWEPLAAAAAFLLMIVLGLIMGAEDPGWWHLSDMAKLVTSVSLMAVSLTVARVLRWTRVLPPVSTDH